MTAEGPLLSCPGLRWGGGGGCCMFFFTNRAAFGPLSSKTQGSRKALGGQGLLIQNQKDQQILP